MEILGAREQDGPFDEDKSIIDREEEEESHG